MPQTGGWQVAGNAAETYERELVPAVFGRWAPRVVELAALEQGTRVLDVACGTGVVARLAAEAVGVEGRVAALDVNPDMLAVAAALPAPKGAAIEWVEASAQALPFADSAFDVVCCQLGLQFFPDRLGALREMARVLAPGGHVVVMVWRTIDRSPGFGAFAVALGRTVGPDAEALMQAPFLLGDRDELAKLLSAAGFRDVEIRAEEGEVRFPTVASFVDAQVRGSPLAAMVAAAPAGAREGLVSELERELGPGSVRFPMEAHLAVATRPA
jgi:ubiquinone/menaquinone biosynthesis C-methylase UbiE